MWYYRKFDFDAGLERVRYIVSVFFWRHLHAFVRRPWVFSRALGCEARRGPACTPRRKFGSRASSAARALGVQSREIWQVIAGLLSAEPGKTMETHMSAVLLHCKSSLLCGSHGTRAVAHQACVGHYYACVDIAYACLCCVCYDTCACV